MAIGALRSARGVRVRAARARRTWLVRRCDADDQLAVAHADVEFAADGEAQLFQPAAA
ncbi:hypothetical protein XGA_0211 [Xanthomonas hortorum ATCC 19865]|nr:hypothetical protein XGA_0211 [Xanthomonas hortorum ATCC 19865]